MKIIYKVLYPIGFEIHEVAVDFPTALPFVEVKPLEGLENEQSQFFNFAENKWEEAVTQDYSKKLELLENLSAGLQVDNQALKDSNETLTKKADSMAQLNAKTMLTSINNTREIGKIKEQLNAVEGGN